MPSCLCHTVGDTAYMPLYIKLLGEFSWMTLVFMLTMRACLIRMLREAALTTLLNDPL